MIKKPIGKLARKIKRISIYVRFRLDGTQSLATFFFPGVLDCAAISASATWENHQPWELQTLPFFSSAVPSTSIWKSPCRIPNHFKLLLASRPREMPQSILLWLTLFHQGLGSRFLGRKIMKNPKVSDIPQLDMSSPFLKSLSSQIYLLPWIIQLSIEQPRFKLCRFHLYVDLFQ